MYLRSLYRDIAIGFIKTQYRPINVISNSEILVKRLNKEVPEIHSRHVKKLITYDHLPNKDLYINDLFVPMPNFICLYGNKNIARIMNQRLPHATYILGYNNQLDISNRYYVDRHLLNLFNAHFNITVVKPRETPFYGC